MAASLAVSEARVESFVFPPTVKPPASDKPFFLAGAGARELEIQGRSMKITAIGVYLEESAIPALTAKWKGKTADDLAASNEFFRDIVTGPFEKFTQVTTIVPLTGQQYVDKVSNHLVAAWKAIGIYTDEEGKAIDKFVEVFKDEDMPPGQSILYTQSPLGSLTIGFSKHETIPQAAKAVIENKILSESILESLIGEHGITPETRRNLAAGLYKLLNNDKA